MRDTIAMTKTQALTYYGTRRALARALALKDHAINSWENDSVPPIHQLRLESLTGGYLRADDEAWEPAQPRIPKADHKGIVRTIDAQRKVA